MRNDGLTFLRSIKPMLPCYPNTCGGAALCGARRLEHAVPAERTQAGPDTLNVLCACYVVLLEAYDVWLAGLC